MTSKPFFHAGLAALYILGVVGLMNVMMLVLGEGEDSAFMPVVMLSLLVLSVSVMAYLFFYKPIVLYGEAKKEEAVKFFLHTVGYFAIFVAIFIGAILALSL